MEVFPIKIAIVPAIKFSSENGPLDDIHSIIAMHPTGFYYVKNISFRIINKNVILLLHLVLVSVEQPCTIIPQFNTSYDVRQGG